tara:strand:- start:3880 stop:4071 length:192 start_codon:yes stop_codon:yes gene_type:complete
MSTALHHAKAPHDAMPISIAKSTLFRIKRKPEKCFLLSFFVQCSASSMANLAINESTYHPIEC